MKDKFLKYFEAFKTICNRYVSPLLFIGLVAIIYFGYGVWAFLGGIVVFLILVGTLSLNFIWFVPTGYVGYKKVKGKINEESYDVGAHFRIPYLHETCLMYVMPITLTYRDKKKVASRNETDIEYLITYKINEKYVHLLFTLYTEKYFELHMSKWIDAVFDNFINKLTYLQIQTQKDMVEKIASSLLMQKVDEECSKNELSKQAGTHKLHRYSYNANEKMTLFINGKDQEIPKLELDDLGEEDIEGVNFFEYITLMINTIGFEKKYEDACAEVIVAQAQKDKAEIDGEKAIVLAKKQADVIKIKADAEAEAKVKMAEAEAEAKKLTGAAENKVREELGQILENNPKLLKDELAKHFPKVFGGANPMINLDDMLGEK